MRSTVTTAAMGVLLAAGVTVAQTPAPPTIRDSAGVRIIEHRTIRNAPIAFTIKAAPTLDLGGLKDDPKEEFDAKSPFLNAAHLSDGRIVAVDYSSAKLLDARGKFIRNIGRRGSGPGEFNQLMAACVARGDTIVLIGYGDRRVSVFDSAGKHVRSFVASGYVGQRGPCFDDGSILIRANAAVNPQSKHPPALAAAIDMVYTARRTRDDGSTIADLGLFPAESFGVVETVGNAYVRGNAVYVGDGTAAEVRVYDGTGRLTQIIRWDDPLTPVTDKKLEDRLQGMLPRDCCGANRDANIERMRARPHLPTEPVYSLLLVDPQRRLWLQDAFWAPEPRGWTVFDASGNLLGRVTLPSRPKTRFEIGGFEKDHVILAWRDEDGAAHISFNQIVPFSRQ